MVSREFERECVVVFDEAHNIDNVCIEALSGAPWDGVVVVVVMKEGGGPAHGQGALGNAQAPRPERRFSPPTHTPPPAVNLRQQTLDAAGRNIATLKREVERVKQTDAGRLRQEYQRLVSVREAAAGWEWVVCWMLEAAC